MIPSIVKKPKIRENILKREIERNEKKSSRKIKRSWLMFQCFLRDGGVRPLEGLNRERAPETMLLGSWPSGTGRTIQTPFLLRFYLSSVFLLFLSIEVDHE